MRNVMRYIGLLSLLVLTGCANMQPLIQKHNGMYGLYLPTSQELMQAMLYREDAKIKLPDGQYCILEHNAANGHTRFLYPNGSYVVMHGWRNMKYIAGKQTPDGAVMGLFLGTVNHQPQTEMLVIFSNNAINSVQLGNRYEEYGLMEFSQNHIVFKQINPQNPVNPLLRLYTMSTGVLNSPVQLATIQAHEQAVQQAKIRQARARQKELNQQEQQAELQQREELAARLRHKQRVQQRVIQTASRQTTQRQMVIQTVALSGGGVTVQSAIPMGHQKIAPQQVNLN